MKAIALAAGLLLGTGVVAAPATVPLASRFNDFKPAARLAPADRTRALQRLMPGYRGVPAGPFALDPVHPVVAGVAFLDADGAEVVTVDDPAATGWLALDEYDDRSPRPTLSILIKPHAKPLVFDCRISGSETQVGYLITPNRLYDLDYDTKKSTTAIAGGHVLIAVPAATKDQSLLIGRLYGPNPKHNPTFFFTTGCEISRLD